MVEVRDADGNAVEGETLKVDFAGTTYELTTDSSGIAHTDWHKDLASGDYYADAYDLAWRATSGTCSPSPSKMTPMATAGRMTCSWCDVLAVMAHSS